MKKKFVAISVALLLILPLLILPFATAAPADDTGFPNGAKIVAVSNQRITGTIDATGYDIGVYVGPGVTGVTIMNAYISGANDHGIYIQDTSNVVVKNCVVTGNGVTPYSGLTEDKAITLAGTHDVVIQHNVVSYNRADGGISVIDDGANHPAQPNPGTPHASYNNVIKNNIVEDNEIGCGIVVASKNTGDGVYDNLVMNNLVIGNYPGDSPQYTGAIVIAGKTVTNNVVTDNTVIGGWTAGIVLHSFAPINVIDGTIIEHNTLILNSPDEVNDRSTGISLYAAPNGATIINTVIAHNTVLGDYYAIWHSGDTNTQISHIKGTFAVLAGTPTPP